MLGVNSRLYFNGASGFLLGALFGCVAGGVFLGLRQDTSPVVLAEILPISAALGALIAVAVTYRNASAAQSPANENAVELVNGRAPREAVTFQGAQAGVQAAYQPLVDMP
jgi:hypothetical protein